MNFSIIDIHIPHTWVFFAGIFMGAALSQATVIPSRTANPEAVKSRKWTICWILLSFSLVCGVCAVFFPGAKNIIDPGLPLYAGIVTGVFFLAFRFKKAVGLPVFLIAVIAVILLVYEFKPLYARSGQAEAAEFTILSRRDSTYGIEVRAAGTSSLLDVPDGEISVFCRTMDLHKYYPLGGGRHLYRFGGFRVFTEKDEKTTDIPYGDGSSAEYLLDWMVRNRLKIPGIRAAAAETGFFTPVLLQTYRVLLDDEGVISVTPVFSQD